MPHELRRALRRFNLGQYRSEDLCVLYDAALPVSRNSNNRTDAQEIARLRALRDQLTARLWWIVAGDGAVTANAMIGQYGLSVLGDPLLSYDIPLVVIDANDRK